MIPNFFCYWYRLSFTFSITLLTAWCQLKAQAQLRREHERQWLADRAERSAKAVKALRLTEEANKQRVSQALARLEEAAQEKKKLVGCDDASASAEVLAAAQALRRAMAQGKWEVKLAQQRVAVVADQPERTQAVHDFNRAFRKLSIVAGELV